MKNIHPWNNNRDTTEYDLPFKKYHNNGSIRKLQCHFDSDMQIYEVETRQKIDGIKLEKSDDFRLVTL